MIIDLSKARKVGVLVVYWLKRWTEDHYKRVRTPVALLRPLSGKYSWERYESSYPPSYGLNSTTTALERGIGIKWPTKVDMPLKKKPNQTKAVKHK